MLAKRTVIRVQNTRNLTKKSTLQSSELAELFDLLLYLIHLIS